MEIVRALDRGLEIILCLAREKREIGASELAKLLVLPKATVIRLARTLEARGFVKQNLTTGAYQLGTANLQISGSFLEQLDFRHVCRPHMEELRNITNQSVSLYVAEKAMRICVERVESKEELRPIIRIGTVVSIAKGAAGKILVAFEKKHDDLYGMDSKVLAEVRQQGYAVSFSERASGIVAVAVPIFNHTGEIVCSMSLNGPAEHFKGKQMDGYIKQTIDFGKKASSDLGCLI